MTTTQLTHRDAVIQLLTNNQKGLEAALPRHVDVGDFVRLALTECARTPRLAECDPQSVFLSLMEAARLGAVPGSLGHGWLIPRKGRNGYECSFQPGYRLFIELARRSGEVTRVEAHVVYERDQFDIAYGTHPRLDHTPCIAEDPGEPIGAYAVAFLRAGGVQVEFMSRRDIEKARAAGAPNSPAWRDWWGEMARKTVLRRAAKLWPLSVDGERAISGVVRADDMANGWGESAPVTATTSTAPEAPSITERITTYSDTADSIGN